MITNIKLTGMYNIGVNESNNIDVKGTAVSIKDIPFVRYKFNKYGVDEINYIKKSMEKFVTSTHMLEFTLDENIETSLEAAQDILGKVAKYIYFEVSQADMDANTVNAAVLNRLAEVCRICAFDRIMMIDKTENLDMVTLRKFIKEVSAKTGYTDKKIGVCNSPLCMTDNLACLTAITARELSALYNESKDAISPSANHQDMNTCGCVRFFEVGSDIQAPAGKAKKTKEKADKDNKPKAEKAAKKPANAPVLSLGGFF